MEDVRYLKKYAEELSFLCVIDSSRRDTTVYPEPNEYEVEFHAPFKNVVGLDLVNATIPRTSYLVEAGANSLVFTSQGTKRTVTIDPGDYTILQLAETLTTHLSRTDIRVEPTSQPAELTNTLRIVGANPFVVHAATSTLRRAMGLGHADLHSSPAEGALGTRAALVGPLPAGNAVSTATRPARHMFGAPASGKPTVARVYVGGAAGLVQVAVVDLSGQLVAEGQVGTVGANLDVVTVALTAARSLAAGQSYYVVVKGPGQVMTSGPAVSTGVDQAIGGQWWDYTTWTGGPGPADAPCVDVSMAVDGHMVVCPGVVNLTGWPYALIKIPEIEQQLYRDRTFETVHAGMGMVELGNYGLREQRYDFVSFPSRRLPIPIGKLPKLTIRLEKGDGTLYDTKGVDHHLVMLVRYLALTQGPEPGQSLQNPRYTPNALEYLQRD